MVTDSFFSVACAGMIGILFGLVLCFAGYRLFIILLPIWGFFFGMSFGAQSMQMLFGVGFLATITSWVVGFIVGAVFAVLSYLFYVVAVALIAGSLGYSVAVGLLTAIGLPMGFLVWIVGVAAAIALAVVTLRFNLAKWVIIIATAVMGAGVIAGAILLMFNPHAAVLENPVRALLSSSPLTAIVFLVVAVLGIIVQINQNRSYTLEEYDRWSSAPY